MTAKRKTPCPECGCKTVLPGLSGDGIPTYICKECRVIFERSDPTKRYKEIYWTSKVTR